MTGELHGYDLTIRCSGHRNRSGELVRARLTVAHRDFEDWRFRYPNGVRVWWGVGSDSGDYVNGTAARADDVYVPDAPGGTELFQRLGAALSTGRAQRRSGHEFRCRGCGVNVQFPHDDELFEVLDQVALAGRTTLYLPDLETLRAHISRR